MGKLALIFFVALSSCAILRGESEKESRRIGTIRIDGNERLSTIELLNALPFQAGDLYNTVRQSVGVQLIESVYSRRGYLDVRVSSRVSFQNQTAHLSYLVREGPLYRFGETRIEGLEKLSEEIVRHSLTIRPGAPYVRRNLFQAQSRLYATGWFEDIRITASTTPAKTADVTITVKERRFKWIKGGVGWGSEEKERATLILTHENFLRRGYRMELTGTKSRIWTDTKLEFANRYFFGTRTEQRTQLSWRHEKREGYDFERLRAGLSLGRKLSKHVDGSVNYRFDRSVVFDAVPEIKEITPDKSDTRAVNVGLSRDTTDNLFYPTKGTRGEVLLERAGGFLGGIINFNKASLDIKGYLPLVSRVVGAAALRTGVVEEYSPSVQVPIFERFFLGGANSVRGYRERTIGDKDDRGSPLGGKYRLGASLEIRYPLFWKLTGALFIDGGQVGFRYRDVWVPEWKYGAGTGIRFITPVGPLRLDYGYKLNPDPGDKNLWRIHFSLGESF